MGAPGSFTVLVDGKVVSEKKTFDFPSEGEIVEAVGKALNGKG